MRRVLLVVLPVWLAMAQSTSQDRDPETDLRAYLSAASESDRQEALDKLVEAPAAVVKLFKAKRRLDSLRKLERGRADEDLAGSGRGEGSTALASAAGVVNAVSAAVESGGFTQATNGTITTIRVKPIAIIDAFAGNSQQPCARYLVLTSTADNKECASTAQRYFRGFSLAASLDSSKPDRVDAQPVEAASASGKSTTLPVDSKNPSIVTFLSQRRAITSFSIRYELFTPRDARSSAFVRKWNAALGKEPVKAAAAALGKAVADAFPTLADDPSFEAWAKETQAKLEAARPLGWEPLRKVWETQLDALGELPAIKNSPKVTALVTANDAFIAAENEAMKEELDKPIFSFEYTNLRPLNQPDTSNFKLLISKPLWADRIIAGGQEGMFSFNVGANLYNRVPAAAKVGRLRDVHAALQWDVPTGSREAAKPAIFTLAAYYQYQIENGLIEIGNGAIVENTGIELPSDAKVLLAPKGGMFIAQAKLTFRAADGKAKVPVGITYSNRTELIKAPEIRGNVGFQFNWDALFGRN